MNRKQLKRTARNSYMDTPRLYLTTFIYLAILFLFNAVSRRLSLDIDWSLWNGDVLQFIETAIPAPQRRDYINAALAIVIEVVIQIFMVGYLSFIMNVVRRRAAKISNLADGFSVTLKIFALILVQGLFVWLWSLLFLIPGIIAMYRYRQTWYILLDDPDKGIWQCIKESSALMRGHKMELFLLDLSFIGWRILMLLSANVLSIWVLPYIEATYAVYYNRLAHPDGIFPISEEEKNEF